MTRLPLTTTAVLSWLLIGIAPANVIADDFDGDGVEDALDVCCNTPPGVSVDADGRPVGDLDEDCDVDLADFLLFQDNFTGPMECTPEVCDGTDNDCNCLIDDMGILTCGLGECYREVEVCVDGMFQTCVPGDPVPEACDNELDDDCDGETDCTDITDCPAGSVCDDPGLHLACTESETCDCEDFWADCDADPANGCETDLDSDLAHCGECGHACVLAHATPACIGGECEIVACDSGWDDCDGDAESGCETDLMTDPDHCGGCGQPCVVAHGTAACVDAVCELVDCDPDWGDCDSDSSNGCETDLRTDPDHCGGCGQPCVVAHGTAACVDAVCELVDCDPDWGDCDSDSSNGCETDLRTDPDHCGGCGQPCVVAHGTAACVDAVCELVACDPGWGDCDSDSSNGCETDLRTDPDHCGECGHQCQNPHGTVTCVAGECVLTCDTGWDDCDGDPDTGCETDIFHSLEHCGGCGIPCVLDHAVSECLGGDCRIFRCDEGWADCDYHHETGCETALDDESTPCDDIYYVGSLCGDDGCETIGPIHDVGERTYEVWVNECDTAAYPDSLEFAAQLESPSGLDYDLYLYSPCGDQRDYSTWGPGQIDTVEFSWSDVYFPDEDDSRYVYVEVRFYSGNRCEDWELTFYGDCTIPE